MRSCPFPCPPGQILLGKVLLGVHVLIPCVCHWVLEILWGNSPCPHPVAPSRTQAHHPTQEEVLLLDFEGMDTWHC